MIQSREQQEVLKAILLCKAPTVAQVQEWQEALREGPEEGMAAVRHAFLLEQLSLLELGLQPSAESRKGAEGLVAEACQCLPMGRLLPTLEALQAAQEAPALQEALKQAELLAEDWEAAVEGLLPLTEVTLDFLALRLRQRWLRPLTTEVRRQARNALREAAEAAA